MKHFLTIVLAIAILLPWTPLARAAEFASNEPLGSTVPSCCASDPELLQQANQSLLMGKAAALQQNGVANKRRSVKWEMPGKNGVITPSTGDVKLLVLPIAFPDYPDYAESYDEQALEDKYFAEYDPSLPIGELSVKGFYEWSSYGKLNFTGEVLPVYTASEPSTYYENNTLFGQDVSRKNKLIIEAINYYIKEGILDLSEYDSNVDGYVDAMAYKFLRPTEYTLDWWGILCTLNGHDFDGTKIGVYTQSGITSDVGTDIHELGHSLGLLDNYGDHNCVIDYSLGELMTNDSVYINVYYKWLLGWIEPKILTNENSPEETVELTAVESYTENSKNECKAVVLAPDPSLLPFTEFFIAEYRIGGVTDKYGHPKIFTNNRRGVGLVIWHCNTEPCSPTDSGYAYKQSYIQPVRRSGGEAGSYNENDIYTLKTVFSSTSSPVNSSFYGDIYTGAYLEVDKLFRDENKAILQAGFRDPDLSPGPVVHLSEPSPKATKDTIVTYTATITEGVGGKIIPFEELTFDHYKTGFPKTGDLSNSYLPSFSQTNPMTFSWAKNSNPASWGNGTAQLIFSGGYVTYNGKKSPAVTGEPFYVDSIPPEIVLTGDNPQRIVINTDYPELGAQITDNLDPDIQSKLEIDASKVDTSAAGTYTVTYSATDHAGNSAETKTRTVIVEEPVLTPTVLTPPAAKDLTYNGSAQELVTPGTAEGGTMEYGLSEIGDYSKTVPTAVNAGDYTVWYMVRGGKGQSDLPPAPVTASIKKAARPEEIPGDSNVPYGTELSSLQLPSGWSWKTPGQTLTVGANQVTVSYNDTQNYEQTEFTVTVTMAEPAHVHSLTKTEEKAATCTAEGNLEYWTCSGCGSIFADANAVTPTTAAERTLAKLKHTPGAAATCTEDQICTVCQTVLVEKSGHDYKDEVVQSTCTEMGYTIHTCARCNDSYKDTYTNAAGHNFGEWVQTQAPACTEKGTEQRSCPRCKIIESREIEPLGHDYEDEVVQPTCTEKGYTTHTCIRCNDSYKDTYTDVLRHTPGPAATCTEDQICTVCQTVLVQKSGHIPGEWETLTAATAEAEGVRVKKCTVCQTELERESIPKLTPAQPSTPVISTAPQPEPEPVWENPFADVTENDWYFSAVRYASENGLFYGTSNTAFSPNASMTRGMLVTVLYRLAKEPGTAAGNLFNDVADGRYYTEAVAWAAENEIVAGYGRGRFGPGDSITREQLTAILWRYAGSPKVSGDLDRFTDADRISTWAVPAMRWAVAEGIMHGNSDGTITPAGKATRAEVAAMLKNYCEKK